MQVIYLIILNQDLFGFFVEREKLDQLKDYMCGKIDKQGICDWIKNNYEKIIILIPIYNDRESLTKLIENINFEVKDLILKYQ